MLGDATNSVLLQQPRAREDDDPARLRAIVRDHYRFLWRSLRRLGVPEHEVDDGAQRVLSVMARRLVEVDSGRERSFLFQTALRVAADLRKARGRLRAVADEETVSHAVDPGLGPDETLDRRDARALLDEVLDAMDLDARAVFVLFELEELSTSEIAETLRIPAGTVSSRLRRAREDFQAIAKRLRARRAVGNEPLAWKRGGP
jgi:RNA polymerase sigma-70 factor (ECF subfamily)